MMTSEKLVILEDQFGSSVYLFQTGYGLTLATGSGSIYYWSRL